MHEPNILESNVRSYSRSFPEKFNKAYGAKLYAANGKAYIDFLSGAGALNYGHNNPILKKSLLEYIKNDGVTHSLDMSTSAKDNFIKIFNDFILAPRNMKYRLQFTGPTGTNAVEAAIKTAMLATGRSRMFSFTNSFHGMTLGSLQLTANKYYRDGLKLSNSFNTFMPYDGYINNSIGYLEKLLQDPASGVDIPAGIIVETIQGEGGVNTASKEWLQALQQLCKKHGILFIIDDIQVGCGRTGTFFSFEDYKLDPDIIVLSKSLSGYGLPMAIVLLKEQHDIWEPGQHNGTFRGNNLAFITASQAINTYWKTSDFELETKNKSIFFFRAINEVIQTLNLQELISVKGRGMIAGLSFKFENLANEVSKEAFLRGLIIETCGPKNNVLKLLPPINTANTLLAQGCEILSESIKAVLMKNNVRKIA